MDMKINAEYVKQLRIGRAMSQEELAAAAGLNVRTIQRIESEGSASLESRKAVASVFGIDAADLDDTRIADAQFLAGLRRGQKWGFGGALAGGAIAFTAIVYALISGEATAAEAGVQSGFVGAFMAVSMATIGIVSERLRRSRPSRP